MTAPERDVAGTGGRSYWHQRSLFTRTENGVVRPWELAGLAAAAVILKDAAVLIASGVASRESLPALNPTHPA